MQTIKIRKIGNSLGMTFPKELLERMNLKEGDTIYVSEVPGGIQLTSYNPDFDKVMTAYKKVSKKYNNALRKLAK